MFLMELYKAGLSYSTINTARSALSTVVDIPNFGSNSIVSRFMKGVFETRKPAPKYTTVWDVSVVLRYLADLYPNETLSLKYLSYKLLMLLLLVSSQRGQTMHMLDLNNMIIDGDKYIFQIGEHLKTSKPGKSNTQVSVYAYPTDPKVCPVSCIREYIKQTATLRGNTTRLFITFGKPHKAVSRDTIARWTKATLKQSGINTEIYSAHSTRAASVSKASNRQVSIDLIMENAGWKSADTFRRFYNKPIDVDNSTMAQAILET